MKCIEFTFRIPVSHGLEISPVEGGQLEGGNAMCHVANPPSAKAARNRKSPAKHINQENRAAIRRFIETKCVVANGDEIRFSEFHARFCETTGSNIKKKNLSRDLPAEHPSKAGTDNIKFVQNVRWRDVGTVVGSSDLAGTI